MRLRAVKSWHRNAVVAASILILAAIGWIVFMLLRPSVGTGGARLAEAGAAPAGVTGSSSSADQPGGGLRLCNKTPSRVGVAIGYKEEREWTTEGWWNVAAGSCETLVAGPLVSRFYYVFALDYDQGGKWSGKAAMCTRDKMFTIHGIEDCVARGYEKISFFPVETGGQTSWTVQLADPSQTSAGN